MLSSSYPVPKKLFQEIIVPSPSFSFAASSFDMERDRSRPLTSPTAFRTKATSLVNTTRE